MILKRLILMNVTTFVFAVLLCFCRELVSWLSNTTKGFDMITHRVHESEARSCCNLVVCSLCMLLFSSESEQWILFYDSWLVVLSASQ